MRTLALVFTICVAGALLPVVAIPAGADSFTIPAYAFDEGNAAIDVGDMGYGIPEPVICNGGTAPNTAEYMVDFPITGDYTISLSHCAAQARPVSVFVDDELVGEGCTTATGSWQSKSAKWEEACTAKITRGKHRIRLQQAPSAPCFPHIVALRFECAEAFPAGAQPHWAAGAHATTSADSFVLPAYAFSRSNAKFEQGYICNAGPLPNIVQYDLDFPVSATYTLHANFAAAEARPVQLYVDDEAVGAICAGKTGSWQPTAARWQEQRDIEISQGKHTITLIAGEPCLPHIVALKFESSERLPEGYAFAPPPPPRQGLPAGDRVIEELALAGGPADVKFSVFGTSEGQAYVHIAYRRDGRLTHSVLPLSPESVAECIDRGQAMARRLEELPGARSFRPDREALRAMARESRSIGERLAPDAGTEDWQTLFDLYLRALRTKHDLALSNPLLNFDGLLLTRRYSFHSSHIYTDHYDGSSRFGGNLAVLSPVRPDGKVRDLVTDLEPGIFAFPELSFDAQRVVFSYKRDQATPYHIYEVNVDGSGLRQLTDGPYDDMDPCYLPNGDIMFVSTRCGFVVLCHNAFTVTTLYLMDRDGGNIRPLSANTSTEFMPSVMPDGRVLYTRWEYVDKGAGNLQSLWDVHPDGTFSQHVFGNHCDIPTTLADARAIPGTGKVVAISAPHMPISVGPVCIIDSAIDMETIGGLTNITPEIGHPPHYGYPNPDKGFYKTPYPLSEEYFLVSYHYGPDWAEPSGYAIYLLDVHGNRDLVYRDPDFSAFDPLPLRPQAFPAVVSPGASERAFEQPTEERVDENEPGVALVIDCNEGLAGIPRGTAKYIRVMEDLPKPHGCEKSAGYGLQNPVISRAGHFAVKRAFGTVRLNADGSARFRVPSGKNIYFQALDENFMELQRMRTFVTYMPGEERACIGCHEHRSLAPPATFAGAAHQEPVDATPPAGGVHNISFIRDAQPVLDKYCVRCHSGPTPTGGLDFSPDRTRLFNMAYDSIISRNLVSKVDVTPRGAYIEITPPKFFGSHSSKLIQQIVNGHQDIKMDAADFQQLCLWVDANAPYYGTYTYSRPGRTGGRDLLVPGTEPWGVYDRRCAGCHQNQDRDLLLNFSDPEKSRFLMAPLSKAAGGWGLCKEPVFTGRDDPDYQQVLSGLKGCHEEALANPRADMG